MVADWLDFFSHIECMLPHYIFTISVLFVIFKLFNLRYYGVSGMQKIQEQSKIQSVIA